MFTQSYFAMNILLLHSPYYLYYSFTNRAFKDGNLSNPVFHLNISLDPLLQCSYWQWTLLQGSISLDCNNSVVRMLIPPLTGRKERRTSMMALLFSRSWRCSLLRKECHELVLNCTYMTWFQSAKTDPNFFFLYIRILALKEKNRGKLRKEKNRVDYITTEILRLGWVCVYEDNWSGEAPISFQSLRRNMGRLKRKQHRSRTEISFSRFNTYINWE